MRSVKLIAAATAFMVNSYGANAITGVPVPDQYSGPLCFQYWLGGKLLGIDVTTPSGVNQAAEVRAAIYEGYQIGVTLWEDLADPVNTFYSKNVLCLFGDGRTHAVPRTINVYRIW